MGPCWLSSNVQSAPSIPLLPWLSQVGGHYWTDRGGFGGHGIYGFHQTFIPAFNSTKTRVERPGSEGRRIESRQSGNSQPISGKQNRINLLLIVHHLTCCKPLRSHYCENQTCKLWKETWPTWEFLGPIIHGPVLAFLPMSRVLPLFHCSLSFHKWGALLNWSGWVWGPWDLWISPNFYSCFQ